jgi:hypothetical protein
MHFIDCYGSFRIGRLVNFCFALAIDVGTFLLVLHFWVASQQVVRSIL